MEVCLIGKTGAGKTTVGKSLSLRLGCPHISSGDIARELARSDPSTKAALDSGLMAPETSMRKLTRQRAEAAIVSHGGFVLDGFPRTVAQLIELMSWHGPTPVYPKFVLLDLTDLDAITRLITRQRDDDNPDALARKLHNFHEETQELIDLLDTAAELYIVDAARSPDKIVSVIESQIKRR